MIRGTKMAAGALLFFKGEGGGVWRQLDLIAGGRRIAGNCRKMPELSENAENSHTQVYTRQLPLHLPYLGSFPFVHPTPPPPPPPPPQYVMPPMANWQNTPPATKQKRIIVIIKQRSTVIKTMTAHSETAKWQIGNLKISFIGPKRVTTS